MRNSDFFRLLFKYLLIMELRFEAMLYSNLGNQNSDAGHIKCSRWLQARHPWSRSGLPKRFCTATHFKNVFLWDPLNG